MSFEALWNNYKLNEWMKMWNMLHVGHVQVACKFASNSVLSANYVHERRTILGNKKAAFSQVSLYTFFTGYRFVLRSIALHMFCIIWGIAFFRGGYRFTLVLHNLGYLFFGECVALQVFTFHDQHQLLLLLLSIVGRSNASKMLQGSKPGKRDHHVAGFWARNSAVVISL